MSEVFNILEESQALLLQAGEATAGRASKSLLHGDHQRTVLIALTAGNELAEHESPLAATLHCLAGKVRLTSDRDEWLIDTGELVPIPPERHAVAALSDAVFLLTVSL